ncbi:UNVERIFIED_CONTAM: histidine phosphatase family protein [Halobacillus marinus]
MKVLLIRHGVTSWNKEKRAQGSADIPLDEEGKAQARMLAARLKGEKWDVLCASPLLRAVETAEIIQYSVGAPVFYTDERLKEVDGGLIEGTTEEERVARWGKEWRGIDLGIEKPDKIMERTQDFMAALLNNSKGKRVIVVTHGGWIGNWLKAEEVEGVEGNLDNTSLTELEWRDGNWLCHTFNCVRHLSD